MSADSPPAALPRVTLAEPAAHRIALNTVSGTTTMDLWPVTARPTATGRAVGISTTATPGNHTHPSLVFRPLVDAPPVPVVLAWREGPGHPAVPDLPALTHAAPASGTTGSRTAPPVE